MSGLISHSHMLGVMLLKKGEDSEESLDGFLGGRACQWAHATVGKLVEMVVWIQKESPLLLYIFAFPLH